MEYATRPSPATGIPVRSGLAGRYGYGGTGLPTYSRKKVVGGIHYAGFTRKLDVRALARTEFRPLLILELAPPIDCEVSE